MPTRRRTSIAFARASFFEYLACARSPSAICQPTGKTGLSAVDGSWNTIAASRPRTSPSRAPLRVMTSCVLPPSLLVSRTAPRVVAVSGSRPRMVRAVTVLPLPLSPTIASTSPAPTDRLTPLTASTVPASVAKLTDRLSMSTTSVIARLRPRSAPRSTASVASAVAPLLPRWRSLRCSLPVGSRHLPAMLARASLSRPSSDPVPFSGAFQPRQPGGAGSQRPAGHHGHVRRVRGNVGRPAAGAQPRIGQVVEALPDQGQAEHDEHDREAGEQCGPPDAAGDVRQRLAEVVAPLRGRGRLDAEAEEAQRGERGDRLGRVQRDDQRQRAGGVPQDVPRHDPPVAG